MYSLKKMAGESFKNTHALIAERNHCSILFLFIFSFRGGPNKLTLFTNCNQVNLT